MDHLSILLLDKDRKNKNDHTWCFWSKRNDLFDPILHTAFDKIYFADNSFEKTFDIAPYRYKMIKGIDFYNHTLDYLRGCNNTDFVHEGVDAIIDHSDKVEIKTNSNSYTCDYVFKSYPDNLDCDKSNFIWQHFKGWVVKFDQKTFDPECAHFMDFRVEQDGETRFFYVLPTDEYEALIEIAIFSGTIPDPKFYDPYIKDYINTYISKESYEILEEEVGAIPMTDFDFNQKPKKRVINIGTNGGSVKGSSGFAFSYIQKETDRLLDAIKKNKIEKYKPVKNRYKFYDSIFLNAILTGKTSGIKVFGDMFRKLSPQTIFKFLDEENNFLEDIKMFTAPPTLPFTKALIEEIRS